MKKIISLLLLVITFSCQKKTEESQLVQNVGEALGTTYSIQYQSEEDYHEQINEIFEKVNQSMSTYIPNSDISRFNLKNEEIVVDDYFKEVFLASQKVWLKTDSLFDPTVGPLVNVYGFGPGKKLKQIDSLKIDSILTFVGLDKVKINEEGKLIKQDTRVYIDFNAIAKGYTIDLIGRMLEKNEVKNYLIEIGGELLAKGINVDSKNDWIVAVDDPTQTEERTLIRTLKLKDKAMATSGNYRKFYIDSLTGEKVVHSINPKTGKTQKTNVLSVSVIAENCMMADAYATAFMILDMETSILLSEKENLDAYYIYLDDEGIIKEYFTEGFSKIIMSD